MMERLQRYKILFAEDTNKAYAIIVVGRTSEEVIEAFEREFPERDMCSCTYQGLAYLVPKKEDSNA